MRTPLPDHEDEEVELVEVITEMNQDELVQQHNTHFLVSIPLREVQLYTEQFTEITANLKKGEIIRPLEGSF